jgi:uncharacterized protein (TIGR02118 family)
MKTLKRVTTSLIISSLFVAINAQDIKKTNEEKTMFNISSIYIKKDGVKFDFDYYLNKHMPRSIELLSKGKGFKGVSVEKGIDLKEQNITSSYIAMCHYYFDTLENFMIAFKPHAQELQGDIINYTNIEPVIQINEVKISKLSQ